MTSSEGSQHVLAFHPCPKEEPIVQVNILWDMEDRRASARAIKEAYVIQPDGKKEQISLNPISAGIYDFSHDLQVPADDITPTYLFGVVDKKNQETKTRLTVIIADNEIYPREQRVDNAASIGVHHDIWDKAIALGQEFLNKWKGDLVYGCANLKLTSKRGLC